MTIRLLAFAILACSLASGLALGRVIPVAQVSPEIETPALQKLNARHAVVVETDKYDRSTRLVIHDTRGVEQPKVVATRIGWCAAWEGEGEDGPLRLLAYGWDRPHIRYSSDAGANWVPVDLGAGCLAENCSWNMSSIRGEVRLGTAEVPFVVAVPSANGNVWAVRADGSSTRLTGVHDDYGAQLLGSDATASRFLVAIFLPSQSLWWKVCMLGLDGRLDELFRLYLPPEMEGWITPSGAAYFRVAWQSWNHPRKPLSSWNSLAVWNRGVLAEVVSRSVVAAPTVDYSGAWIAVNEDVAGTSLKRHTPEGGLVEMWRDPASSPIVSLHPDTSGRTVLVHTRRIRHDYWNSDAFGIGLWQVGSPSPPRYDELILGGSWPTHAFVHLEVDAVAGGAPFLIDTGNNEYVVCAGWCPEVPKPLGLVRASLKQQLVIPASARLPGEAGAVWRTDLLIRNLEPQPVAVTARFLPNLDTAARPPDATLTIAGGAIAVLPDVLSALFHLERGSGAILLLPEGNRWIRATSRTYTRSAKGTYGTSVDGVDVQAAARAGFPLTFSAGLLGDGFRTNLVATNISSAASTLDVALSNSSGAPLRLTVPANEQVQLNALGTAAGADASATRAVRVTPASGAVLVGLTAIDDRTNDPSWMAPDRRAEEMLRIPVLVHADGANGAKFRTDLYLFNPEPVSRHVWLKDQVTLAPDESRVIPDALFNLFGLSGAQSLRVGSTGVRMTTRTYTGEPDRSTYGIVVPPLDALQMADAGETLEILGPTGGPGFRTNLALVGFGPAHVEILDETGRELDAFDVQLEVNARLQIDDLFRARGLGDGPEAAAIRVTPTSGGWSFAAYATTIDNGTNDASYFAGALGSH